MRNTQVKLAIMVLVLLMVGAFTVYVVKNSASQKSKNNPSSSILPDQGAIDVATKYLQARENSNGADQSSPEDWLNSIKSITTDAWFKQLQPNVNATGSGVTEEYRIAHENGYIVKATLSGCTWVKNSLNTPTTESGTIRCDLTDKTTSQVTGNEVPATSIPFGWSHNGQQQPAVLNLVKQNGAWLVNGEGTDNSE